MTRSPRMTGRQVISRMLSFVAENPSPSNKNSEIPRSSSFNYRPVRFGAKCQQSDKRTRFFAAEHGGWVRRWNRCECIYPSPFSESFKYFERQKFVKRFHPSLLRFYPRFRVLIDFENSDDCSKGSQEPNKQLTSPEVIAFSNSSD